MWKKEEEQTGTRTAGAVTSNETRPPSAGSAPGRAVIGPSISIRGDVTGSEDLLIQGKVDGSVTLEDHAVGVGPEGRVNADIVGRVITIEGRVEGDLQAQEQIVLRGTAHVKGDIKAPRVVLEDGANFRGLVDMGTPASKADQDERKAKDEASSAPSSKSANGAPKVDANDANGSKDASTSNATSGTSDESKGSKPKATSGGRTSA